MTNILISTHLTTVLIAGIIGAWMLISRKGTRLHRWLGFPYMALMMLTAIVALFLPGTVGPRFLGHFGYIHIFSLIVLYTIPMSLLALKHGNIAAHRSGMQYLYAGGIGLAGMLAFMPGRTLHQLAFGG